MHDDPHIDPAGFCQCDRDCCTGGAPNEAAVCICADCDPEICGLHDPAAVQP
jgi:hypothetical protein